MEPDSHTLAITLNGLERTYIVYVPAAYRPQTPAPLVIMLHGGGGTARAAMWETGWAQKADKEGFLAAFPNALARDPAQPATASRSTNPVNAKDVWKIDTRIGRCPISDKKRLSCLKDVRRTITVDDFG